MGPFGLDRLMRRRSIPHFESAGLDDLEEASTLLENAFRFISPDPFDFA
jgi:hypothetical protein